MLCPKCNAPNPDGESRCFNCGEPLPRDTSHLRAQPIRDPRAAESTRPLSPVCATGAGEPSDYLVLSIVITVCCCPPFGIPAIVFAAKSREQKKRGEIEEARKSAQTARVFCIVGIVLGLVFSLIYLLFMLLG
jgi:hypothetical protein